MLRRIVLDNYMSHAHTVIDLAEGLTVLVGPNNCGKSAVVAALETICFNPGGDYMVRHGQKLTQVTVETADGHEIVWRRKGGSVSYHIDGRPIDRQRRAQVPDDLHKYLRLPRVFPPDSRESDKAFDVHIASQKSPIFLLDESKGRRAIFFASGNDTEKLLEMQRRHREHVGDAKKDKTQLETKLGLLDAQLKALSPLEALEDELRGVEAEHRGLLQQHAQTEQLERSIAELKASHARRDRFAEESAVLVRLVPPPALHDTDTMSRQLQRIEAMCRAAEVNDAATSILRVLQAPPTPQETGALEMTARGMTRIAERASGCRLAAGVLSSLREPPAMEDAAGLAMLCQSLARVLRQVARDQAVVTRVEVLAEAPIPRDTAALEAAIMQMRRHAESAEAVQKRHACLSRLGDPPVVEEPRPLADLARLWKARLTEADACAATLRQVDEEMAALQRQVEQWAEANPTCPLCGADTDASRILSGGHHHG